MLAASSTGLVPYDAVVVGLGGHGSAALYHLATHGVKVLGLEQFSIPHARGSSHGESRIIRLAYHEHSDYVPLLQRAWALWQELQAETEEVLLYETGCIAAAPPSFKGGNNCFQGALSSAKAHQLDFAELTGDQVNAKFPGYQLPSHYKAVLGPGGILASERCILAHISGAQQRGATVHTGETVLGWTIANGGQDVIINTQLGAYIAKKAIFAAGSWMPQLVPELKAVLTIERQVIAWFDILDKECCQKDRFPVCVVEDEVGPFYAFPQFEEPGMKIGKFNHLGEAIDCAASLDRTISHVDEEVLREGVAHWFPSANGSMLSAASCMFTNTPDSHFLVDWHPHAPQVLTYVSDLPGKDEDSSPAMSLSATASVLGEAMADLLIKGQTRHNLGLHRISEKRPGHAELLARFAVGASMAAHSSL